MTTRYYEERECEHGDIEPHGVGVNARIAGRIDCPGGQRRELVIDYAEAWKTLQGRDELRDVGWLPHSPRETELAVRSIVDAALGRFADG